ncbi:probable E3 ubiquitin-protein ligase HERC4 isoform X2 [Macrosteles quadrilineatus]|uniref:probable E3 ubiquitin-protein ligase HERC4 isoform X2 n=1 Tax=Macrosteles quadrilineatus TaxID=74068 RepID=UPI0023E22DB9|nr:probable E3 ubiquitin-protein ligase HERC4 isoform X2 [Macrosteles quadrilineatus]
MNCTKEESDLEENSGSLIPVPLEMFCWGNTANGELGLGGIEDHQVLAPRELTFTDVNQVKYVACGKYHTVLVTNSGSVFSCGSNDFGQLGHDKQQKRLEKVDGLDAYKVHTVACGEFHTLAVNEWGQVFSWGCSKYGQLGHGDLDEFRRPKIIRSLATSFVVQVSCGYRHCMALTNNGQLFAWGCNDSGQLGLGNKCESVSQPTLVKSLGGVPLAFISSGGSHSFAVSKSGAVFGWGKNNSGQLGLNNEVDSFFPAQLKTLRSIRVKYIACGEDFSVFLTQDGGVFTCGAGQYGQLGHGSTSNEILPRKVLELMGTTVTQISCGRRHTLALVPSRGRIYAFGLGCAGQLGTKAQLSSTTPQVVVGPWLSPSGISIVENNNISDYVVKRIYAGGDQCFVTVTRQKDKVAPEDLRILDESSQILTLSQDKLTACQKQPTDSPVDQDLLTYLETVLSNWACLNGSFLLKNDDHYCCTSRHHGVNLNEADECFHTISRIENETLKDLIKDSFLGNIIPQMAVPSPPDVETLRVFITVPLYHEFNNAKNCDKLQTPFASAVLALRPEAARVVGLWYVMMSSEYFERLIIVYKSIILRFIQNHVKTPNLYWYEGMRIALELLAKLNKLNQTDLGQAGGLKVPYDAFHLAELTDHIDISLDYIKWVVDDSQRSTGRKYFCDYPFLFDPSAKTSLLQTDQALQMHSAMNEASTRLLTQMFMFNMADPAAMSQFLELHVTRENIVQDTIRELSNYNERDFKKPLKVTFLGEEAEDAGGVRKEFFLLLLREILDPKYGMFRSYEETNAIWFSESSFEDEIMYFLIGLLCGLAIYNFTIIALPFPLALYKKLLGEPVSLQDLAGLSPTMARSLQQLLDYQESDVEDVFCLNFELVREVFGETKHYPLKQGGEKIPVTHENKKEYVELYVDFILNKSVERHFRAFRDAFHKVCGGRVLKLFHAHELMAVVIGNENYDWEVLENNTNYKGGYSSSDTTIRMFWEVFHELPLEEKKKFLLFLTGTDRIPIQGMKAVHLTIQPTTDDKYLPVAHTCFNLLDLPRYGTKERLRYKLLQAIQQTQGFSLV